MPVFNFLSFFSIFIYSIISNAQSEPNSLKKKLRFPSGNSIELHSYISGNDLILNFRDCNVENKCVFATRTIDLQKHSNDSKMSTKQKIGLGVGLVGAAIVPGINIISAETLIAAIIYGGFGYGIATITDYIFGHDHRAKSFLIKLEEQNSSDVLVTEYSYEQLYELFFLKM